MEESLALLVHALDRLAVREEDLVQLALAPAELNLGDGLAYRQVFEGADELSLANGKELNHAVGVSDGNLLPLALTQRKDLERADVRGRRLQDVPPLQDELAALHRDLPVRIGMRAATTCLRSV